MKALRLIVMVARHYGVKPKLLRQPYPKRNAKDAKTMAVIMVEKYCKLKLLAISSTFLMDNRSSLYHLEKGRAWIFQEGIFRQNYLQLVSKISKSK
jgi:hypothetical protein